MTHDFLDVIVSKEGRYGSRHITPKKKKALNLFLRCHILGSRGMEKLGRGFQEGQLGPYGVFRKAGVLVLMMMVVWGSVLGPRLCKSHPDKISTCSAIVCCLLQSQRRAEHGLRWGSGSQLFIWQKSWFRCDLRCPMFRLVGCFSSAQRLYKQSAFGCCVAGEHSEVLT